jgi:hypothetical protein
MEGAPEKQQGVGSVSGYQAAKLRVRQVLEINDPNDRTRLVGYLLTALILLNAGTDFARWNLRTAYARSSGYSTWAA